MKAFLMMIFISLFSMALLSSCASPANNNKTNAAAPGNDDVSSLGSSPVTDAETESIRASGTPSPLNTNANPWTNVSPQVQGQIVR